MRAVSEPKAKVEVVFTPEGIEVVRLYGESWSDQPEAVTLFDRLSPLIRHIHELLSQGESGMRPS